MNCAATGVVTGGGRITGVTTADGEHLTAKPADRRRRAPLGATRGGGAAVKRSRRADGCLLVSGAQPRESLNRTTGVFAPARIIALIDRGDYWQCAFIFAKGSAETIRARGIDAFRADVVAVAPVLGPAIEAVASWDDVKLLTVALDRLTRWYRPGLLAIGDAAHAMSPVGGVGINLAIQDAVAAADELAVELAPAASAPTTSTRCGGAASGRRRRRRRRRSASRTTS